MCQIEALVSLDEEKAVALLVDASDSFPLEEVCVHKLYGSYIIYFCGQVVPQLSNNQRGLFKYLDRQFHKRRTEYNTASYSTYHDMQVGPVKVLQSSLYFD
jgi:hypothetical protein